jgi:hypothetical protein
MNIYKILLQDHKQRIIIAIIAAHESRQAIDQIETKHLYTMLEVERIGRYEVMHAKPCILCMEIE